MADWSRVPFPSNEFRIWKSPCGTKMVAEDDEEYPLLRLGGAWGSRMADIVRESEGLIELKTYLVFFAGASFVAALQSHQSLRSLVVVCVLAKQTLKTSCSSMPSLGCSVRAKRFRHWSCICSLVVRHVFTTPCCTGSSVPSWTHCATTAASPR
mmetsp:Transcript_131672/g.421256  ORF Transcript_131672/g.421256 Transcript_131672/m.421256 type:complete len:154 (-) Transcript_131672:1476-1937(-)